MIPEDVKHEQENMLATPEVWISHFVINSPLAAGIKVYGSTSL